MNKNERMMCDNLEHDEWVYGMQLAVILFSVLVFISYLDVHVTTLFELTGCTRDVGRVASCKIRHNVHILW